MKSMRAATDMLTDQELKRPDMPSDERLARIIAMAQHHNDGDGMHWEQYVVAARAILHKCGVAFPEVLADLEAVAENFDRGWRAEPPTMAALVRRVIRELRDCDRLERVATDLPKSRQN